MHSYRTAYLLVPRDVLVPEHGLEEAGKLELRQDEASRRGHHRRRQRSRHTRRRQELGNVRRQSERHRTVRIQLA